MEIKTKKIIIDFGIKFTKVGFEGDSEPRKILPTPELISLDDYFEEKTSNFNVLSYIKKSSESKLEIEDFACYIINDVLQIFKSQVKIVCIILLDLDLKDNFKEIYISFIKYIYETFPFISSIKVIPKKSFPIFVSGFFSGIILNSGFLFSSVTVVNNGISFFSKKIGLGSCDIAKMLYKIILNDKKGIEIVHASEQENFKKKLIKYMDDILVRVAYIMNKKVSSEYKFILSEKKENEKEIYSNVSFYDDLPAFNISFNSRVIVGEKLFGDNSEDNLSFIVLKTILEQVPCEIRRKIGSNIILSGGMTMLNGFYQRFVDEINFIATNNPEFSRLKGIKSDLHIHKIIFPRNILTWVGASLFLNFNNLNFVGNEINRNESENISDKESVETAISNLLDNLRQ